MYDMGPHLKSNKMHEAEQYREEAKQYFALIQEDKLIRLQFEWNEGNIELEGIECNADLAYYFAFLWDCPFLPRITKQEVDDLAEFLASDEFVYEDHKSNSRFMHRITDETETFEEVFDPGNGEWQSEGMQKYHFWLKEKYNLKPLKKEALKRANKENYYFEFIRAENIKAREERMIEFNKTPRPPQEMRPFLRFHKTEEVRKFIKTFEEPKLLKYHDAIDRAHKHDEDSKTFSAIHYLENVRGQVMIYANENWREAIIAASTRNIRDGAAYALYLLYEDYCQNNDKSTYSILPDEFTIQFASKHKEDQREGLLRGRELAGKPRDFNF